MLAEVLVQVPKVAWSAICHVLDTPLDQIDEAVRFISGAPPLPDVEDLAEECAKECGVSVEGAEALLVVAISLNRLQRQLERSAKQVIDLVPPALERQEFPDWHEMYAQAWSEREPYLVDLLTKSEAVEAMSKARELLYEFQCILRSSMVLTDVRHVYNAEASAITGGLVLHTLSLEFTEGGQTRQLHLTLSDDHVAKMITQLTRAQKKARVSADLLQRSAVPELTPRRGLEQ